MDRSPRISVVTACLDPERSAVHAVESVLAQGYPGVEHIVVAGASSRIALAGHPHVTVVADPGRGRAAAINAGFERASGDIMAMLDGDAVLLPGALDRVVREIDPARGRHVVMGRCRFVDGRGRFTGIEHPSRIEAHRRILEIWRGPAVPPNAVFWTAQAWSAAGPVDERVAAPWADYDLCCRLARAHRIHRVDQVLAACPPPSDDKAGPWARAEGLADGIALSRRHWGTPLHPVFWRLALSLAWYRFHRVGRARRLLRRAGERRRRGESLGGWRDAAAAALVAPEVVFYTGVYPRVLDRATRAWRRTLDRAGQWGSLSAETTTYLEQTEAWSDGWVGPRLAVTREIGGHARSVGVRGWANLQYFAKPLVLTIRLNGRVIGRHRVEAPGDFLARIALAAPLPPGEHTVDVEASTWFVPDRHTGSGDLRPLAWRLGEIELDGAR